jgi:membrane fusion protein
MIHCLLVFVLSIGLVAGVGGWAVTTELSSAVVAPGIVVVDSNVKKIQHLTGGIVSRILVKEGEKVHAGQVLIQLDGTTLRANLSIIDNNLAALYLKRARMVAENLDKADFDTPKELSELGATSAAEQFEKSERELFSNRKSALQGMEMQIGARKEQLTEEADGLTVQIGAIESSLALIDEELVGVDRLYSKGLVTFQRVTTLKRERAQLAGDRGGRIAARAQLAGKASELDLQILQLSEDRRKQVSEDLPEVEGKIAEYEDRRVSALDQLNRLDITAPLDGSIYKLAIHTINGVVNPGEELMLLVPQADDLTVQAKVATRDIDQIHVGQMVQVRFSAFNQRTTPQVDASIATIAPDIITDEKSGISYYPVSLRPDAASLSHLKGLSLYPGMPAEVYIKIGDRTVISYLMKPMMDQLSNTFREE